MTLAELLAELDRRGVRVGLEDGRLCITAPLGALTPDLEGEIRRRETEVAGWLAGRQRGGGDAEPDLVARGDHGDAPLSFAQERLWFIEQLEAARSLYNVPALFQVEGEIDVAALERALTGIVARHEALRTTIVVENGEPRQRVGPPRPVAVRLTADVPDSAADATSASIAEAARLASEPFDLTSDLMLRADLIRYAPRRSLLLLTAHHIAADGWSMQILARELAVLYRAALKGERAPALPSLPVQYADFAAWQRRRLAGPRGEADLEHWRSVLAGVEPIVLPTDRLRPRRLSRRGERLLAPLAAARRDPVTAFCRGVRVTPFVLFGAAFAALLHRLTGETRVSFGTPVANRDQAELEHLIGFFVNTLVPVVDCGGDPTFVELLRRFRGVMLGALGHQQLPFERLVEALRPVRDLGRNPLFDVMFAHHYTPLVELDLPGLRTRRLDLDRGLTKFDLSFETSEDGDGYSCRLEYSTELFERPAMEGLAGRYARLLDAALAAPDTRLSRLPLMDDEERRRVVSGFNDAPARYPRDETVVSLFASRVAAAPSAVAIEHGGVRLTYAELDARAAAFAVGLRAVGVTPGGLVGLSLERSPDSVVAMLAVLRAGAAYLPIAVDEPAPRAARIVTETGASLVVATADRADELRTRGLKVVSPEELGPASAALPLDPPHRDAGRVAYVMYTSGSTGVPKGIAVPHRAIVRLVIEPGYVGLGPTDAVAHLSNPAFDASTFEVWGALLNGARVVIFDRDDILDPPRFAARVRVAGVTVVFLTTALFNELVRAAPEALSPLDTVLFGGETAAPDLVRRLLEAGPPRRLVHVYGPTECTTFATAHQVAAIPQDAAAVPIGRPISGTTAYVLDGYGELVPPGFAGELYLGGDGLALGYVNNETLTAERFVPDPFAATPGGRLYRTGDIVRWRNDGQLEFLARSDDQVKLRGFRVEPGEIAAVLRGHPAVREAVVVPHRDEDGEVRLVAYTVPAEGRAAPAAELRRSLQGALPPYMVPSVFVSLAALPLTPNGKIDTQALPPPPRHEAAAAAETPLEKTIAAVFATALGVERIGVDDDFFTAGGHSLLAARVVARLARELSLPLQLRDLFVAPTVRGLALRALALRIAALPPGQRSRLLTGEPEGET